MSHQEERVADAWKAHWETSRMRPDQTLRGRVLRRYIARTGGLANTRHTLGILRAILGDVRGATILDAGSGTGLNSLALAHRGANVTLLDIAPRALEIARTYYDEQNVSARYVEGSIFQMPFSDATFDVVWNTGVIEHFEPAERARAVREMLRVMKPTGTLITINPSAEARVYRFAKEWAERHGRWDVGFELPIATLADDIDPTTHELSESSEGWLMEFHFLKFFVPRSLRLPFVAAHEAVQRLLPHLNERPGYLKISVIRRRNPASSADPRAR